MQHGWVEEHNLECVDCLSIFEMINELRPLILVETENDLFWVIFQDLSRQARAFISHRLRTASTKHIHSNVLESIGENHCLIILDFKQKLLKESGREAQRDWLGKNAFASLHGAALLTKQTEAQRASLQAQNAESIVRYRKPNSRPRSVRNTPERMPIEVSVQFVDMYSSDTTQDTVWVSNALELLTLHFREYLPHVVSVEVWCDNAATYHNAEIARFSPLIFHCQNIELRSIRFFEAGEGKSLLDRHFATVRHGILDRLASGLPFDRLTHVSEVLRQLTSVYTYQLTPNRNTPSVVSKRKITAIASYHDWRYHCHDERVTARFYKEVFAEHPSVAPGYTEQISYLQPSFNMNLPNTLPRTGGSHQKDTLGDVRSLPSLIEPKQFLLDGNSLTRLRTRSSEASSINLFPAGWGRSVQKENSRFPPMIVRALKYFFHQSDSSSRLGAEVVCDQLAQLIREGHISERALTEQQIKSWFSSEKKRNHPRPSWFIPNDPSCIWNNTTTVNPNLSSNSNSEQSTTSRHDSRCCQH